jgi:hypothetical protein
MGIDANVTGIENFEYLELIKTGVATIDGNTTGDNDAETIVNHNLGFVPIVIAYLDYSGTGGGYRMLPTWTGRSFSGGNVVFNTWVDVSVTSSVIDFDFYSGTASNFGTFNVRYYLFRQKAKV